MSYIKDIGTFAAHHSPADAVYTGTFSASPSPGNAIILHVVSTNTVAPTGAVSDSKGNTWVRARGLGGSMGVAQFLCLQDVAPIVAGDTYTINFGATNVSTCMALAQEHSGITGTDTGASASWVTATTARTAGTSGTTTQASDVVIATFGITQQESSFTPGTGYSVGATSFVNAPGSNAGALAAEYQYVSAIGAFAPTGTGGVSATGAGVVATYKVSSGGTTKQISGNVAATSAVSGGVTAKKRITPTSGILATSAVSGVGGTAPGSGGAAAGFGISTFGVATFGDTGIPAGGGGTGGGGTGGGTGGSGSVTPGQPDIVPPSTPTGDAIIDFIESSPPGLFPENDESNFGFAIRGLWCAKVEDLIGQQDLLYKERFVATSDIFLDEWERMTGTPANPSGFDKTTRRAIVLGRIRKGPFTRAMRKEIIERYLKATFGGGVTFGPSGIPINAGIVLTGGTTAPDVSTVYKVVENISGFSYTVYILNTYTPSAGLQRELDRVTPAGISYTISFVATLP